MEENILGASDLKNTKRREAVFMVLKNSKVPMTAEEIYSMVIKNMHMSISTTYRTLSALSERGIILKNLSQDGKAYYQLNNNDHKHYLKCAICNEIIPIKGCPLETLEKGLVERTGYIITGHNLEFSGICPKCLKNSQEK